MRSLKTNAILNLIQNVCKVLFPLITVPYASRVLEAANYGKVSFGNSIVRYFILFAALGVSTYSQREAPAFRDDKEKISEFSNQIFSINIYSTIISYFILAVLLVSSFKLRDYALLILIQSFAILLGTVGADWINVVYEDYFYITVRYVVMQCVSLILLFLLVKTPSDYYIYAIISVIATAGGNIFNVFYIRRYVELRLVSLKQCVSHLKPVFWLFCVSITTVIYVSSDITILGFFMTDIDVGIYTMATNIYSVVKQIISAIIVGSIPRMAYYIGNGREDDYCILAKKVLNAIFSLLLPAIVGMALLSRDVLFVMGGKEYMDGQLSMIILSISLLFAIMAGFYSNGYLLLAKKDSTYLFATTLSAVINIGLNFIFIPWLGILGAAITTLIAEAVMTIVSSNNALKKHSLMVNSRVVISSLVGSVVVGVICISIHFLELHPIMTITVSFAISVPVYFLIMKVLKNPLADSVFDVVIGVCKKIRKK